VIVVDASVHLVAVTAGIERTVSAKPHASIAAALLARGAGPAARRRWLGWTVFLLLLDLLLFLLLLSLALL
jgi:hypothetical protein